MSNAVDSRPPEPSGTRSTGATGRILRSIAVLALLLAVAGCGRERRKSPMEGHLESLYESGYGFNNPKAAAARERARR